MAERVLFVPEELEGMRAVFEKETEVLGNCAEDMSKFKDDTVAAALESFKSKITEYQEQVKASYKTLNESKENVCGDGYEGGLGWQGEYARQFVEAFDSPDGMTGAYDKLGASMEELTAALDNLNVKLGEAIDAIKNNVKAVSESCGKDTNLIKVLNGDIVNL